MKTITSVSNLRLRFLSILLLYFVVFASSFLMINALACHPDQIQALLQFKNEFESDGCNHISYLSGAQCENTTGAVTRLQLPNGCFTGILKPNSSLFGFHHIRYLNLSHNNFTSSSLPFEFSNLNELEVLSLSSNGFTGQVPSSYRNLTKLTQLDLSHNELTGSFQLVQNLTKLSILDLSFNHFGSVSPLSINLFSAWNNSFTGEIPLSICNQSSLDVLDLSYNNFSGSIPQCLSKLTTVNLRRNNLQGILPDTFYSDSRLQTLDVGYNQINGMLPRSLVNCSFLKLLSVEHNKIKDVFPFWLKVLPDLQVLNLRSNRFYGPISPPQGPLGFPELRILEISDNIFTGNLSPDYFVNWSASSSKMIIGDKQMYMGDYKNALYQYFYTSDLRYKGLYMEHEKVLTFYATIDFSANKLSGQIPESIGLLTSVIALNLSNNSFTGQIPQSFANVTELESLDLSQNKLSGKIPQELGSLSFLAYINVSHNKLKGEIPKGTQISGQPISSFEGNAGLCGLPLEKSCFDIQIPQEQRKKQEDDEDEEQVLNWKAVAVAYVPGVLFGLAIGHVIALYKQEWLVKIIGPNRLRNA